MALANQAALTEMFRQAFSPLVGLSSGRLALQQAALLREAEARQHAQRRQQAREDQFAAMRLQDELTGNRQIQLEQLRRETAAETAAAQTGAGMYWNQRAQRDARDFAERAEARKLAANLGLDVDPADENFVNKVTTEAAKTNAKHRGTATEVYRQIEGINQQLEKLATQSEIPPDKELQIARRLLLSGITDTKRIEEVKKFKTLDQVLDAADDMAYQKIDEALKQEKLLLNQTFEKRARPLVTRQTQLQSTLKALEQRGISPDWESLKAVQPSSAGGGPLAADEELSIDDVNALFSPQGTAAAPDGDSRELQRAAELGLMGQAVGTKPGRAATRAIGPALRGNASLIGRRMAGTLARGAAGPVGALSLINDLPTFAGGEPMSASLAGLALRATGNDYSGELERSHAALANISALLPRVTPDQARRLRALRYAPHLDEAQIGAIVAPDTADTGSWLPSY